MLNLSVKWRSLFIFLQTVLRDSQLELYHSLDRHETLPVESSVRIINNCATKYVVLW